MIVIQMNLIANELVIVKPMSSITGFIQYIQFVAGSNKGEVEQGDLFNDPFRLGEMSEARMNYTSMAVVEPFETGTFAAAWTPVLDKSFYVKDGVEVAPTVVGGTWYAYKVVTSAGVVSFENDPAQIVAAAGTKVAYKYNNVIIPQNDIPTLNARVQGIPLAAKARRIAIYYSQLAAFQSKTEMGVDLGEMLATQACAELSYEIDTEIVKLLDENAGAAAVEFNKALPYGVSKMEHYEGFAEVIEQASQIIYDKTQKHAANYMVIASNVKPILSLMRGWKAAATGKINGPYFAGTLNGVKVFVSPALAAGRFFLGFNGDDLMTSAAVYAPYMA